MNTFDMFVQSDEMADLYEVMQEYFETEALKIGEEET